MLLGPGSEKILTPRGQRHSTPPQPQPQPQPQRSTDEEPHESARDQDADATAPDLSRFAAPASAAKLRASKSSPNSSTTYTPLERQILDLKAQHPGVLLIIEVGYKFKFYGDDARVAAQQLNIMCFPERNLLTAMIPVHRLHIHIKKLIAAGYKVGVVRQTETRALKAASANANTPFVRKLDALYTASTWVDDLETTEAPDATASPSNTLLAVVERLEGGNGPEDRIACAVVAVNVATASILYDQFTDGHARSELETRLAHLAPAELLLPPHLSRPTEKMLAYLASSPGRTHAVRIERATSKLDYNAAFAIVTAFYEKDQFGTSSGTLLSLAVSLPQLALVALANVIRHLESFGLASICRQASHFESFTNRTTMTLNANTLANLDVFTNSDYPPSTRGSLIWLLDRCKTAMGKRLLRRWVGRPLVDRDALKARTDAVAAIMQGNHQTVRSLPSLLQGLPDLERGLARMSYARSSPSEVATVLLALSRLTNAVDLSEVQAQAGAPLLTDALCQLPLAKAAVQTYLNQISISAARANDKADLFVDQDAFPRVQDTKDAIAIVESELREHLGEVRKLLRRPTLEFTTVAGIEYLIEVRTNEAKRVPADWLRVSATKAAVRFHTPTVLSLTKRRERLRETLEAEADAAFRKFVHALCTEHYVELRNVVASVAILDALGSLAIVAALPGYVRPDLVQEGGIDVRGLRHAMVEAVRDDEYVPNDVTLGPPMLLTGSNMGGKSSLVRALALAVILAQIGSYVPASSARLPLHDAVLTRMGASDDLLKGRSTFLVELEETSHILRVATPRSLVILDELGRGTSTHDGLAIAHAVLTHLSPRVPHLIFTSHYHQLTRTAARNCHMATAGNTFLYRLTDGPATRSFGIHCARIAGLPQPLLEQAQKQADRLEREHRTRSAAKALAVFHESTPESLDLLANIAARMP